MTGGNGEEVLNSGRDVAECWTRPCLVKIQTAELRVWLEGRGSCEAVVEEGSCADGVDGREGSSQALGPGAWTPR